MPDAKLRRLLLFAGAVGLLFACNGMAQIVSARSIADLGGARLWLLLSVLVLLPLFLYLLGLRRRGKRATLQHVSADEARPGEEGDDQGKQDQYDVDYRDAEQT
ncbi:MAG: hypothetical protein ACR2M0_14900 [Chloroflexia bacterium]